jgi:thymidylate synthase (FAD)
MVNIIEPSAKIITDIDATKIKKNIERAARCCYKSEDKISEGTESADKIIKMLLTKHHEAMIEFSGDIDVEITVDIGAQRDFSRHRHISMACESTRYCCYNKDKFGGELKVIKPCNIDENSGLYHTWLKSMEMIEKEYMLMAELGAKPDQMRLILPLSTACTFHMSCNIREWRHILSLRTSTAAHPSVQKVANSIYDQFCEQGLGLFFEDIKEQ